MILPVQYVSRNVPPPFMTHKTTSTDEPNDAAILGDNQNSDRESIGPMDLAARVAKEFRRGDVIEDNPPSCFPPAQYRMTSTDPDAFHSAANVGFKAMEIERRKGQRTNNKEK